MNSHTLHALDFPKTLDLVAQEAHSGLGRRALREWKPEGSLPPILARQARISEMLVLLQEEPQWPPLSLELPDDLLARLATPGLLLEAAELLCLTRAAELALACARLVAKRGRVERCPLICALGAELWSDEETVRRCRRALDPSGAVLDDASPALRRIRRRLQSARQETSAKAEGMLRGLGDPGEGRDHYVTLRSGRYVLTLPANQSSRLPGILHDRSASGRTLFVEPLSLVDANNALTELETEEQEEVRRILRELTQAYRARLGELRRTLDVLADFDAWGAAARWSLRWGGAIPRVVPEMPVLHLVRARHPLLCKSLGGGGVVVPLDLDLHKDLRCLVVSGPNMGGKSVLLKTVGVTVALAMCGLPVLAGEGTTIGLVDDLLVDIGDEQSIESDLSTFAGHLRNLKRMDDRATSATLVLIDELGSGTDPLEGEALGVTLLEELCARGVAVLVTTHMSAFKEFASRTPGAGNGCMEFDPQTLRPRFHFLAGIPGRSHAFEVAALEGWPRARLERAERRLADASRDADRLLRELEGIRETMRTRAEETDRELREARAAQASYAGLSQRLKERLESIRAEKALEEDRSLAELRRLRKDLQDALAALASGRHADEETKPLLAKIETTLRQSQTRRRVRERPARLRIPVKLLLPGRAVWCDEVKSVVTIDAVLPKAGKARVWAGVMRIEVPLGSLREEVGGEAASPEPSRPAGIDLPAASVPSEIDLRGLDREEGIRRLDHYLDRALLAGLGRVRIIHGFGTGVLRDGVAAFLRRQPFIGSSRPGEPGEGGEGVTIAFLGEPGPARRDG